MLPDGGVSCPECRSAFVAEGSQVISAESAAKFVDWLESHEDDIATGINDFSELSGMFKEVFGRLPGTTEPPKGRDVSEPRKDFKIHCQARFV